MVAKKILAQPPFNKSEDMSTLTIDFETSGTCDLKKTGAWIYSRHPDTKILCMAWAIDAAAVQIWYPGLPPRPEILNCDHIEAHNFFFERSIWTNSMVKHHGWPEIPVEKGRCSAALAASRGLPRGLEQVAEVLNFKNRKDPAGKKFIFKTNGPKRKELTPDEFTALCNYCKQDVEVERELSKRLGELSDTELKVWQLDQRINLRGIHFDRASVKSAIKIGMDFTRGLKDSVAEITSGAINSTNQVQATIDWLKKEGVEVGDLKKGTVEKELQNSGSDKTTAVLKIRQALSKNSVKKLEAMLHVADTDDQIRECFLYHGASTGRWTGKLVQLQNLPRGTISDTDTAIDLIGSGDLDLFKACYPDVMGAISSCIRGMLTAKPGYILIAADYNAIETRVLFWLAGEIRGSQKFRDGVDLYVDMAADIYKTEKVAKTQRQVGKTAILGLGYQMGAEKFKTTCDLAGITMKPELAEAVVKTYREKYTAVVQFWYSCAEKAILAVQNPSKVFVCGKVEWQMDVKNNVLCLRLPSKRCLRYWWPSVKNNKFGHPALHFYSVDSTTKRWTEESTYGGKLVENAVQAVARDLLAEAMVRLDEQGHQIVLTAHDEVVIEVADYAPKDAETALKSGMEELPSWATGLPIKAETWVSKRYRK